MSKLILNEELPLDLREALERDAAEDDITINDAATRVLAKNYEVKWEPSGFRYRPVAARFKLRVPTVLHREIRMDAANRLATVRGVVLSVLAEHYGAVSIDPHRRSRKEVA